MITPLLLQLALWSTTVRSTIGSLPPDAVFTTLRHTGPPSTVVDLVLLAEAYVAPTQFHQDAARLTHQIFDVGGAYHDFAPFVSVHTLFLPSRTDHVGKSGTPVDTPFQLYREAESPLRSILPTDGHTYPLAQQACQDLAPRPHMCDYLVIMAHDRFYGGLGDDIAIVSSSPTTGAIGLRHELGHNFADIGEEYDGGQDYSGGNFAQTRRLCQDHEGPRALDLGGGVVRGIWPCIPWKQWLTTPLPMGVDVVPEETSALLVAQWPWHAFTGGTASSSSSRTFDFYVDGFNGLRGRVVFSTAGVRARSEGGVFSGSKMEVLVDGVSLRNPGMLVPGTEGGEGFYFPDHDDRHFQTLTLASMWAAGHHTITFTYAAAGTVGRKDEVPPQLCHVMVYTLGELYHDDANYVGAYPVYSAPGKLEGYRPTRY